MNPQIHHVHEPLGLSQGWPLSPHKRVAPLSIPRCEERYTPFGATIRVTNTGDLCCWQLYLGSQNPQLNRLCTNRSRLPRGASLLNSRLRSVRRWDAWGGLLLPVAVQVEADLHEAISLQLGHGSGLALLLIGQERIREEGLAVLGLAQALRELVLLQELIDCQPLPGLQVGDGLGGVVGNPRNESADAGLRPADLGPLGAAGAGSASHLASGQGASRQLLAGEVLVRIVADEEIDQLDEIGPLLVLVEEGSTVVIGPHASGANLLGELDGIQGTSEDGVEGDVARHDLRLAAVRRWVLRGPLGVGDDSRRSGRFDQLGAGIVVAGVVRLVDVQHAGQGESEVGGSGGHGGISSFRVSVGCLGGNFCHCPVRR